MLYAIGVLGLLCAGRFLIVRFSRNAIEAVTLYLTAIAVAIPAVWLFVAVDWDNEACAEIVCWVGMPVAILTVPSLVFVLDLCLPREWQTPGVYALRCVLEVGVLVPAWCVAWVSIEFYVLYWMGV